MRINENFIKVQVILLVIILVLGLIPLLILVESFLLVMFYFQSLVVTASVDVKGICFAADKIVSLTFAFSSARV